jgi:hypothetical protein
MELCYFTFKIVQLIFEQFLSSGDETIKRELSALSPQTLLESDPDYARFALNKIAETGTDASRDNSKSAGFMASQAVVNKDPIILDMNRDERIGTSGAELFVDRYQKADGSVATGGFDALSDIDSNGDNIVDSKDEEYDKLLVSKLDSNNWHP